MKISTTEEIISEFKQGHMVVVMDDENRENEGDVICPATACTPEVINFMAQNARGLICLALSKKRCEQLDLHLMVKENHAPFSTAFTTSIEAAKGVTTGISAGDRATTVLAAVAPDAKPEDIVKPGHVFPLIALEGGVLVRTGHTEASTDFARLAGLEPAAVICEVMKDDGSMARRQDLEAFCEKHNLKLGTVADLVEYRMKNETTVKEVCRNALPTKFGDFELVTFEDTINHLPHMALIHGDLTKCDNPLVRVHSFEFFSDVLHTNRSRNQSFAIEDSMERIANDTGILLLVNNDQSNDDLFALVKQFAKEDAGSKSSYHHKPSKRVGIGSQILKYLGVKSMRLMSTQTKYHGLSGYGLNITEFVTK